MKKNILIVLFALAVSAIVYAYQNGAAAQGGIDATGASGTSGCSTGNGCHTSATTDSTKVELDSAGVAVTSYYPGKAYTVKISGINGSSTSLTKFGFQLSVVKATGAGTAGAVDAGTWGTSLPASIQNTPGSSSGLPQTIIEQNRAITATSGGGAQNSTYMESIPWTAPDSGTGSVVIYGVLNELRSQNQSKYQVASHITIKEAVVTQPATGVNEISADEVKMYPNPAGSMVQLNLNAGLMGADVKLYDSNGRLVTTTKAETNTVTLPLNCASGIYLVQISKDGKTLNQKLVKL